DPARDLEVHQEVFAQALLRYGHVEVLRLLVRVEEASSGDGALDQLLERLEPVARTGTLSRRLGLRRGRGRPPARRRTAGHGRRREQGEDGVLAEVHS